MSLVDGPPVRLSTVSNRAFPVAAAQIWNVAVLQASLENVFTTTIYLPIAL